MKQVAAVLSAGILCVALGYAARPEATVTSTAPFRLHGAVVPVSGVKAWPLPVGEEVAADSAAVMIRFVDKTSIQLQPGSVGRLEQVADHSEFRLLSGDMEIIPSTGSKVAFYSQNQQIQAPVGQVTRASAKGTQDAATITTLRARVPPPPGISPPKSNQ